MANDWYEPEGGRDNWDDAPQKDDDRENAGNDGNFYKRYAPPTGGGYYGNSAPQPPEDADGALSRTLGIIGLIVTVCSCQIAGIVLGIIGLLKAKKSARDLGFETSNAATGRVLGIVNIVLGSLLILFTIAMFVFYFVTGLFEKLLADAGAETAALSGPFSL